MLALSSSPDLRKHSIGWIWSGKGPRVSWSEILRIEDCRFDGSCSSRKRLLSQGFFLVAEDLRNRRNPQRMKLVGGTSYTQPAARHAQSSGFHSHGGGQAQSNGSQGPAYGSRMDAGYGMRAQVGLPGRNYIVSPSRHVVHPRL